MSEPIEAVAVIRSLVGDGPRIHIYRSGSERMAFGRGVAVLPWSDGLLEFSAEELSEHGAVRVFEVGNSGDEVLLALESFVGGAVWVDGRVFIDGDFVSSFQGLGFQAAVDCPGLFLLADRLRAGERWAAQGRLWGAVFALSGIDVGTLEPGELRRTAELAIGCGEVGLAESCWLRLAGSDRSCRNVYARLAWLSLGRGDKVEAWRLFAEAERLGEILDDSSRSEQGRLEAALRGNVEFEAFQRFVCRTERKTRLREACRVLVVTNLFPPQEMGGYGRKMWEFAFELRRRGHQVRVLCGDVPRLRQLAAPEEVESEHDVLRTLALYGDWEGSGAQRTVSAEVADQIAARNGELVAEEIERFRPDYCLSGNLDFIGYQLLEALRRAGVPTVQCLGNATPGWPIDYEPSERFYRPGPASYHLAEKMKLGGYTIRKEFVLYPGVRFDYFYREVLPVNDLPRIVFAGIILPYKGPQTLVEALGRLHEVGIDFRATIAGPEPSAEVMRALRQSTEQGCIADRISFVGYQDRAGLRELFMRHNILVFPSIVEEAFGISQVEAMASGLAVISSATGGAAEVIEHRRSGLVFKAGDGLSLAQSIAALVADPQLWRSVQENGRERAKLFAVPVTVDRIESMFIEMDGEER